MNDLVLKYLLEHIKIVATKEKKIEIGFLDEHGAGITEEDELYKKLIFTDEEDRDFSKI